METVAWSIHRIFGCESAEVARFLAEGQERLRLDRTQSHRSSDQGSNRPVLSANACPALEAMRGCE